MPLGLRKLLLDLIADDPFCRDRASCTLTSYEDDRLGSRIEAIVAAPDFPRRYFYTRSVEMLVTASRRSDSGMHPGDGSKPPANPHATTDRHRREGIEWCIAIDKALVLEPPQGPAFDYVHFALQAVVPYAVDAALEAPATLWALLETPGCKGIGATTLELAGRRAAPLFLPELLHYFRDLGWERVNFPSMLSAVGRGDPRVISAALEQITITDAEAIHNGNVWPWAVVLAQMDTAAATPEALSLLHDFSQSPLPLRRAIAAFALPALAPEDPATAEVILRLLHDPDRHGENSVLPNAINSAARLPKFADRLIPRLVELLTSFQEPNPDYGYDGRAARVCKALIALPEAPQAAVPKLRELLRQVESEQNLTAAASIIQVLNAAADAAAEALPELRALHPIRGHELDLNVGPVRMAVSRLIRKLSAKPK